MHPRYKAAFLGLLVGLLAVPAFSQIQIDGTFKLRKSKTPAVQESVDTHEVSVQENPSPALDVLPQPLNLDSVNKWIGYPPAAEEAGLEGKVWVKVLVDERGRYQRHAIESSTSPIFTQAVEKGIPLLRFRPGKLNSQPTQGWTRVPFRFVLLE